MKLSERMKDAFFLAIVASILGGSTPIATKIALEVFHPFTLITIRFVFATLFLLPFVWRARTWKRADIRHLSFVGFVGALNPIIFTIGLQYIQASATPLIYAGVPALTALYFYFVAGKKISRKQAVGIILGFIGVSVVVILPLFAKHVELTALRGNLLIVFAAIAFMFYGILSKEKQNTHGTSPLILTFYLSFIAMIVSLPFTFWEISHVSVSAVIRWQHIVSAIYTGVVSTGIFYLI